MNDGEAPCIGGVGHGRTFPGNGDQILTVATPQYVEGRIERREAPRTLTDRLLRRTRTYEVPVAPSFRTVTSRYRLAPCGSYHVLDPD